MARTSTGESGFTLVEVLSAAMIAAFAMTGLYAGLGSSLRATERIDRHLGARIVAQSVLAELARAPRTIPRDSHGTSGDYTWNLTVERAPGALAAIHPRGFQLYDIKLAVAWSPNGRIEVNAVRLAQ